MYFSLLPLPIYIHRVLPPSIYLTTLREGSFLTAFMMTIRAKLTPEVLLSAPRRSAGSPNSSGKLVLYTVSFSMLICHAVLVGDIGRNKLKPTNDTG